jgi:thymidine phosphorylase
MNAIDVIRAKRDGHELTDDQIDWVIDAYVRGVVAEEQMAALAMAILLRGMTPAEIARWTGAMIASGSRLDLGVLDRPTVDKHSTGGVGDKITLVLTPLVAACGAAVPQLSGRGLGHTGGTLDKLEAIPGWRAHLTLDQIRAQLRDVGAVVCAAGADLAPADARLYALRDVTGTVESIPLIASSIMSKKIAEGTGALVLDVKVGTGAFMADVDSARELAVAMVGLGRAHDVATVAVLTDMSTPLGRAAGNALEVAEAVDVLAGAPGEVRDLTLVLAREMLTLVGIDADPAEVLDSGAAMDSWRAMIRGQGGDPTADLPTARHVEHLTASRSGVVSRVDARAVGVAAWRLGAGRSRKEDAVSAAAGVVLLARPGDPVKQGDAILALHADDEARIPDALAALDGAVAIGGNSPPVRPLVLDRID